MNDQLIELVLFTQPGCTDTIIYKMEASFFPIPSLLAQDDSICLGIAARVYASGTEYGGSYNWFTDIPGTTINNNNSTQYLSINESGWVWATAESAAGCVDTTLKDSVYIFVNDSAVFEMSNDTTICLGDQITVSSWGGTGTYTWTSSLEGALANNDSTLLVAPTSNNTYFLQITNGDCSYSDYTKVYVTTPVLDENQIDYCAGSATININESGYATYEWIGYANNTNTLTINNPTGDFTAKVALETNAGCKDTTTFIVQEVSLPTIDAGEDVTICSGSSYRLEALSDYDNNNYVWTSIPAGLYSTNPSTIVSPTQTTSYRVQYSNALNCVAPTSADTIVVNVDNSTEIDLGQNIEICIGESATLSSSTGTGNYTWRATSTTQLIGTTPTVTVSPSITTTYQLTLSNAQCANTDYVSVIVNPLPNVLINHRDNICIGDAFTITPLYQSGTSYTWTTPTGIQNGSSLTVSPTETTTYTLTATDQNGCIEEDTFQIEVVEYPTISLPPSVEICEGSSTTLNNWYSLMYSDVEICEGSSTTLNPGYNANYTYVWDNNGTTTTGQTLTVSDAGIYEVTVTDEDCSEQGSVEVTIEPAALQDTIANIFTPNGDGVNDVLIIPIANVTNYECRIYSRWGELVFHSTDPDEDWDGKNALRKCPSGAYFYIIEFDPNCDFELGKLSGFVQLIR